MASATLRRILLGGLCLGPVWASPLYEPDASEGSAGVVTGRAMFQSGSMRVRFSQRESSRSLADTGQGEFMTGEVCVDAALADFCRQHGVVSGVEALQGLQRPPGLAPDTQLAYADGQFPMGPGVAGIDAVPGSAYPLAPGGEYRPGGEGNPLYAYEPAVKDWAKRHGFLGARDFLYENRHRLVAALLGVFLTGMAFNMLLRSLTQGARPGRRRRRRRRGRSR